MVTAALSWLPLGMCMDDHAHDDGSVAARDGRLVAAALKSPDDYRHLVALYQGRVYATALRLLGSDADARDVSQEAFLRAYAALARFQVGRRFGPWICTIAANAARDQLRDPLRRFLRYGLVESERPAPVPDDGDADGERRAALAAHLLKLKPKIREAVVLRYVSEMSVEEVAEALGIGVSAAKMRIKRGLEQLEALARAS